MTCSKDEAGGNTARRETNEIPRFIFSLLGQSTGQKQIKEGRKGEGRKKEERGVYLVKSSTAGKILQQGHK